MASKPDGSWQVRPEFGERRYRRVDTHAWDDSRVRRFSTKGRLVWLYLLTAPNTTSLPGLYKLREEEAANHCGLTLEGFREGFAEPFLEGMVEADWEAGVVWIRKAPRHEWPTGPNVVKGWRKAVRALPESTIIQRALAQIRKELQGVFTAPEPFLKAFADTFPEGFAEPSPTPMLTQESGCRSQQSGVISSASQVAASAADAVEELPDATADAVDVPQRPTLELLPCPSDAAEAKPSAIAAFVAQAPLLPEAVATAPAKPKRTPAAKREPTGDSRHAPLVLALVEAHREAKGAPYGFQGGKDARAVSDLLMLADQDPATQGEAAPAEILRRWGIALRWRGFPACTGLLAFRDNWNAYVLESGASPTGNTTLKPTKFIEM